MEDEHEHSRSTQILHKIFQVWWEAVPLRQKVIGYEVFYSMTAVEDLDQWQRKTVGLTTSIDLVNMERHAQESCTMGKLKSKQLARVRV